jgi:hypothetical protein
VIFLRLGDACQAEVGNFQLAIFVQQDVRGLQVSVKHLG